MTTENTCTLNMKTAVFLIVGIPKVGGQVELHYGAASRGRDAARGTPPVGIPGTCQLARVRP